MSARLIYVRCPYCPEVRNAHGLSTHILRVHSEVASAN